MKLLDLFSGIGGFSLAASWAGIETVQFVEYDQYCQKVLAKNFKGVPIHGDIKTFKGQPGSADVISGGFPCQPFSCAGQQRGAEDDRALWPEMLRVIKEVRPSWVIAENVAGIINMELDNVFSDLATAEYRVGSLVIPACGVDAPHKRTRVWIVAHAGRKPEGSAKSRSCDKSINSQTERQRTEKRNRSTNCGKTICNTSVKRLQDRPEETLGKSGSIAQPERPSRWPVEPGVGRVANGIPKRVDRLKGLGNAIVPQVAYEIFKSITNSQPWASLRKGTI